MMRIYVEHANPEFLKRTRKIITIDRKIQLLKHLGYISEKFERVENKSLYRRRRDN